MLVFNKEVAPIVHGNTTACQVLLIFITDDIVKLDSAHTAESLWVILLQIAALLLELANFLGCFEQDCAFLRPLLLLERVHHLGVLQIDLAVHFYPHRVVLFLLGHVKVDRVIVSRELVALEKLNSGLVQLENDNLMQ